jgi:hypothetical protein
MSHGGYKLEHSSGYCESSRELDIQFKAVQQDFLTD